MVKEVLDSNQSRQTFCHLKIKVADECSYFLHKKTLVTDLCFNQYEFKQLYHKSPGSNSESL